MHVCLLAVCAQLNFSILISFVSLYTWPLPRGWRCPQWAGYSHINYDKPQPRQFQSLTQYRQPVTETFFPTDTRLTTLSLTRAQGMDCHAEYVWRQRKSMKLWDSLRHDKLEVSRRHQEGLQTVFSEILKGS